MNNTPTIINVWDRINSPLCVDVADGEKIYPLLHKAITEKKQVVLSFKGIEMVITAFLNAAVGQLYRDFNDEEIKKYLTVADLNPSFQSCWNRVIANAPKYYANQERLDRKIDDILED